MWSNPLYLHLMWAFINVAWSTVLVSAFLRAGPHAICLPDVNNPDAGRKDSLSEVERRARPQRNKRRPVKSAVLDSSLAAAPCRAKVCKASQPSAAVRERVREWLLRIDSTPRLVSPPRSRSFERMMTNDRQPPPTPFSSLAKRGREGGREREQEP